MSDQPLVSLRSVRKHYVENPTLAARLLGLTRTVQAVTDVDLDIFRGETLGLVGESGCGKSTLARCVLLLEDLSVGTITFDGQNIASLTGAERLRFRRRAQIVFQDPQSSLNRSLRIVDILRGPLSLHRKAKGRRAARERIGQLLQLVGLAPNFMDRYPHELSGGQLQRVGTARALSLDPEFIVLDEPLSALDVSIQAQIVNLLHDLQERLGLTYLFISHDLNVVRYLSDRVAVMYLGRGVESGPVEEVYNQPRHPYTQLLFSAVSQPDPARRHERIEIKGEVPSPINPPSGCPFHPRCPQAHDACRRLRPELLPVSLTTRVACHLYTDAQAKTRGAEAAVVAR